MKQLMQTCVPCDCLHHLYKGPSIWWHSLMIFVWNMGCFLKAKSQACQTFKAFKALVENETRGKIKTLRSNMPKGWVYLKRIWQFVFTRVLFNDIVHHKTQSYTPYQNGVDVRMNRTMWVHSLLGYYFWDKGIKDFVALDLGVNYDFLLFNQ